MNFIKHLLTETASVPSELDKPHFLTLDGLRGLSIILVIFYHIALSNNKIYTTVFNGALGVNIFFVLSGFLITTLCIKEKVLRSNLDLKKFYIRRILRILPVAYLFLFVVFILNLVLRLHMDYINFLGAGLFLYNFAYFRHYTNGLALGHFWSLATEEQFYLFFPFLLKTNYKLYLMLLLVLVFVVPVLIYLQIFPTGSKLYLLLHYLIKFQSIASGCLFSILVFKFSLNFILLKTLRLYLNLLILVVLFYLGFETDVTIQNVLPNMLISLLTGCFIILNLTTSNDVVFRMLNNKVMAKIGLLSYSIYIWQQIFTLPILPKPLSLFPYNLVLLTVVSCLSFYFYESYFIRLKSRHSKIRSYPAGEESIAAMP